jgi:sugar lactone lactonase YvrE
MLLVAVANPWAATASNSGRVKPSVRLVGRVPSLTVGEAWAATMRVVGQGTPRVAARLGAQQLRFRVVRVRRQLFGARIALPAAGTWQLLATLGSRRFALARIRVTEASLQLDQPAQALVEPGGTLLIAERGSRDRILRVDPATGATSVFAIGLSDPFGLVRAADGTIFASSGGVIVRIPRSGGAAQTAFAVDAGPLALGRENELFYANRSEVGRIDLGSGRTSVFTTDVRAPHGLAVASNGQLFVADSGNNRLLRIDPLTGAVAPYVMGLRNPLGLALAPDGSLIVAEYSAGTVLRIDASGQSVQVAAGFDRPYAIAIAGDATIYVVESGELSRPSGQLRRIRPGGAVETIRLRPL